MERTINPRLTNIVKQITLTIAFHLAVTLLLLLLRGIGFSDVNIVVVYILSVLITSSYMNGYAYGIVSSVMSMLSYNFFFTDPIYTLKVNDSDHIITLVVMLISSVFTSTMASKLIQSKRMANQREKQSEALYNITSSLAKTSELSEVASVSSGCLSSLLDCDIISIIENQEDLTFYQYTAIRSSKEIIETQIQSNQLLDIFNEYFSYPIRVKDRLTSYICIPKEMSHLNHDDQFLLDSTLIQITITMERVLLVRDKEAAKTETERERYKNNLLRAISHDLRTPLTRITGAAQMLQHNLNEEDRINLIDGIYEDSSWLTRLVENILSLTRIQEGKQIIHVQQEAIEEIIAGAIRQASKHSPDRIIKVSMPEEVLFVPMDGKLIEQVLVNLMINAIEHTAPSDEILITVIPEKNIVWFVVKDSGEGIPTKDLDHIFEMFYVSKNSHVKGKQGIGLGLTICKAIINFHGGEIYAENNALGGSTFRFFLKYKQEVT